MSDKKDLDKKKATDVVSMDVFEEDANDGIDLQQEDMALPFIKIASAQDDELMEQLEGLKSGDVYNSVTLDFYKGANGIRVIPCAYQRRFLQWAPRGEGSGAPVAIFAPEEERPRTERNEHNKDMIVDGEGHYIEETHQHYVLQILEDGTTQPGLISMKSTQLKKSRNWNSLVGSRSQMGKNGPFVPARYSHIYKLETVKDINNKGSCHGCKITVDQSLIEENRGDLYQLAKGFAHSINKGEVVVKHEAENVKEGDVPF